MAQLIKNMPAMRETWVRSLGWEYPLEKGTATRVLENSMDCIVLGVTKSQTRLGNFHFHRTLAARNKQNGETGNRIGEKGNW